MVTRLDKQLCHVFVSLRSKRFLASSSRKLGREHKKKKGRGRGRGMKEPLARKPHDFEKLRSPTNAASDWRGAGSVDYLAIETSIKPGILCLRASQIWFVVADYKCFGLMFIWIVFVPRFIRSKSSKYNWRSSSGDKGRPIYWEWRRANLTGKNGLF